MRTWFVLAAGCLLVTAVAPAAQQRAAANADVLKAAGDVLGVSLVKTIRFTGFGANFSVGQSPTPNEPWPRVTIKSYEALVDYDTPAMQIDMIREQGAVQPRGGGQPFTGEQRQQQVVSGGMAWNVAVDGLHEHVPVA